MTMITRCSLLTIALALSGCGLLGKSKALDIRYFTPEVVASSRGSDPGAAPARPPSGLQLRMGRVQAASYLRERIAYREPGAEIGFYSKLRWAEPPEEFVRRSLSRRLFQDHGVQEIVSGTGASLEVDLEAFEELRSAKPAARIQITWRLRGPRTVIQQRTLTIERPIAAGANDRADEDVIADALVAAMSQALAAVVDSLVSEVVAELERSTPSPAVASPAPAPATSATP